MTSHIEFERGPYFHGYSRTWFSSDVTSRVSLVKIEPDVRLGGLVREYFVLPNTWQGNS